MITKDDVFDFVWIASKSDWITRGERDFISTFLKKIITFEDWEFLYRYTANSNDTSGISGIIRTYELMQQIWESRSIFLSLFSFWVLDTWKKGNIHETLIPYVLHFLENTNEKTPISYILETFWNISKIREACERRLKGATKK